MLSPSDFYSKLPLPEDPKPTPLPERGTPWGMVILAIVLVILVLLFVVWLFGSSPTGGLALATLLDPKHKIEGYSTV